MVERERNEKDGKFGGIHRSVKEAARERTQARQRAERQTYRQIKTDRLRCRHLKTCTQAHQRTDRERHNDADS